MIYLLQLASLGRALFHQETAAFQKGAIRRSSSVSTWDTQARLTLCAAALGLAMFLAVPQNGHAQPFGNGTVIDSTASDAQDVHAADIDGDGDSDVLSATSGGIVLYENDGGGSFEKQFIADTTGSGPSSVENVRSVYAADIDGDGDTDVIAGSNRERVTLYVNNGEDDPSFTPEILSVDAQDVQSVYAADVNGDGDTDVLSASQDDDTIAWYENDGTTDPSLSNFTARTITTSANGAFDVFAADVNGDDTTEVLSASRFDDTVAWYERDGDSGYAKQTITNSLRNARSVHAADIEGDGDQDVVATGSDFRGLVLYENDGSGSPSFTRNRVGSVDDARDVFAADVNGDGSTDLLSASDDRSEILLFTNNGAEDFSFSEQTLAQSVRRPRGVYAVDVDGDGDTDPLSVSNGFSGSEIAYYENGQVLQDVIYVDADATGSETGSSWANAYSNLQDALPDSSGGPVEIWVADGTYQPDEGTGVSSGDRNASFTIRTAVKIYGGFDGTDGQGGGERETQRSQRDPTPDSTGTVLSGNQGEEGFRGDDAFHVVTVDGGTAILDGLVVQDGLASGSSPDNSGAGIWVKGRDSDLTVRNALITDNAASGDGGDGGGVRGDGAFENVTFRSNSANDVGGGISGFEGSFTDVTFRGNSAGGGGGGASIDGTFTNVTFRNNSANGSFGSGGGLDGGGTLTDVTFRNNSASDSGGGMSGSGTFTDVTFQNNSASDNGGGMLGGGTLTDVVFRGNEAGRSGGGLSSFDRVELERVTFRDNTAGSGFRGGGGGAYTSGPVRASSVRFSGNDSDGNAGGLYIGNSGEPISNAVFSGNEAGENGGALYIGTDSSPKIVNASFTNNTAGENGGTVYSTGTNSFPTITNSILWGNSANTGAEIFVESGEPSIGNSIVQGGVPSGAFDSGGVLDQDPLFANPRGEDGLPGTPDDSLQLGSGSPAIDAGSNDQLPADSLDLNGDGNTSENLPLDLAGSARVQNVPDAGEDDNFVVDLGAYETDGELPNELANGDVDGSGDVSPNDASLALRFFLDLISLGPAEQRAADFDGDGTILPFDASLILRDFLDKGSSSALAKASSKTGGTVRLGEMQVSGSSATIPVQLSEEAEGVRSVALDLTVDPAAASVDGIEPSVPEDWVTGRSADENGQIAIGLAGTSALNGGQSVAEIQLSLTDPSGDPAPEGTFRLNGSDRRALGSVLSETPSQFSLKKNYPNPFRQATTIEYALAESRTVTVSVYDMLGRRVQTLVNDRQEAGRHRVKWDSRGASGEPVASGIYFYRIEAGEFTETRKAVVVR